MRILKGAVTGASGFVGRTLCELLRSRGVAVRALVREHRPRHSCGRHRDPETEGVVGAAGPGFPRDDGQSSTGWAVGEIGPSTDWARALAGIDWVVHCAARAHVRRETAADPMALYREINVEGTRRLAEQAAGVGVRRIVFVSSIGVMGTQTNGRAPFLASQGVAPESDYAVSKWEAEQALWQVSRETGIEAVIVRPPLVYGAGARGNFLRLMQLIERGVPLPLGSVENRRSLVGIDNLADFLVRCTYHPAAAGQTFLVSDDEDLSTPDLIRRLARAMGRHAWLLRVPVELLRTAARIVKFDEFERLVDSLQVDIGHTRDVLGWEPGVSVDAGLRSAAEWFALRDASVS